MSTFSTQSYASTQTVEINKVLKNTYWLLAMTLLFSALTAGISTMMAINPINPWIYLIVTFGLLFGIHKTAESSLGILMTFLFTGWLGFYAGPIVSLYSAQFGSELVIQALGTTALTFVGLSMYVVRTQKDFSFMRGFLFAGLLIVFFGGLINLFVGSPVGHLVLSSVAVLLASGLILFDTSRIVNGGETNYVRATIQLYLDIYMLFMNLLSLLGSFNDE